ncbi:MAG: membrane protein insertion efficiency factor YidD [Pseudomonadota bacterium]
MTRLAVSLLKLPIHIYRYSLSLLIGPTCRYQPTCSEYALTAIETHGPVRGVGLAMKRILRCHPWGGEGYDPVPPKPCCTTQGDELHTRSKAPR